MALPSGGRSSSSASHNKKKQARPPPSNGGRGGGGRQHDKGGQHRPSQQQREERRIQTRVQEMELLRQRVVEEAPEAGSQPFHEEGTKRKTFAELPISKITLRGLDTNKFTEMTDIQLAAIPHALAGRDVLGAAKTGSGKTLAFVVPLLEKLYREGWSLADGLGALVITPTRELALQIFEVLRAVGRGHMFSAALLTGGKKEFGEEQRRVPRMNIIVATPGRLLQHMEETPGFDASQVQLLVLDEADRILDMGFREQLNAILAYLPAGAGFRQTLLFSATQTKSVKDLARLSLASPQYVGVHDKAAQATPDQLVQNYVVVPLHEKLDMLWSFIKSHLKHKVVVFFSSCSQVRYVYECFRCMQPGTPLLALHGKIKQARRTHIYFDFVRRPAAVLFATDIAARGLDFPACDWVVQVDAPEDAAMYIHRVGRTARYTSGGRSLLFLLPSEEPGMLALLGAAHVANVKRLTVNPSKTTSVRQKAASVVAANMECKRLAQKAFCSYLRSVALMPHKEVFDVAALETDAFSESLGLPKPPSTKFLKPLLSSSSSSSGEGGGAADAEAGREGVRAKKNRNRALERLKEKIKRERAERAGLHAVEGSEGGKGKEGGKGGGRDTSGSGSGSSGDESAEEEGEEDDLLVVKRKHEWGGSSSKAQDEGAADAAAELEEAAALLAETSGKRKKKPEKFKISVDAPTGQGKKIVFGSSDEEEDDDDDEAAEAEEEEEEEAPAMAALKARNEAYVQAVQSRLAAGREEDRAAERERIREKHKKKRLREKGLREDDDVEEDGGGGVVLGSYEEEEEEEEEGSGTEGDGDEFSSDDEEEEEHPPPKRARAAAGVVPSMSLQEQEEAVLRSLRGLA